MEDLTPREIVRKASGYGSVLELGCGDGHYIKQVGSKRRVGIDVFKKVIDLAVHDPCGTEFRVMDALHILEVFGHNSFECIIGLDILEHFRLTDALVLLTRCTKVATKCIMWFIPVGNHPQTEDDRGLGNDYYQTHRSTWYPEMMEACGYQVWYYPDWHKNAPTEKEKGAMCCVRQL
jgi:SAM-dependent methyltransferase